LERKHEAGNPAPLNKFGVAVLLQAKRSDTGFLTFSACTSMVLSGLILASAGKKTPSSPEF
jgi:hypothetical protein